MTENKIFWDAGRSSQLGIGLMKAPGEQNIFTIKCISCIYILLPDILLEIPPLLLNVLSDCILCFSTGYFIPQYPVSFMP